MSAPIASHDYRAFGLTIRSCLPLPAAASAEAGVPPEVEIRYADVPGELPEAVARGVRFQSGKDRTLLLVDGVARFLIEGGQQISIARESVADEDDVRAFLLAPAFAALLQQRHDLVLRASAIEWRGEAVVFLGQSGTGRSTLAAAFRQRGHAILTDELCVVRPGPAGRLVVVPAFAQLRLWPDSLRQLGIPSDGLHPVRRLLEKRIVPLGDDFARAAVPVKRVYLQRTHGGPDPKLRSVSGSRALALLQKHVYRFGAPTASDPQATQFQVATKLVREAPLTIAVRPNGAFSLAELVTLIESDLQSTAAGAGSATLPEETAP